MQSTLTYIPSNISTRIVARVIDWWLFVLIPMLILIGVFSQSIQTILYGAIGWYILHHTVIAAWLGGQTLGKKILGIKIIPLDGNHIGSARLLARLIALELSFIFLPILLVGVFRKDKRFLHDLATRTRVVKK